LSIWWWLVVGVVVDTKVDRISELVVAQAVIEPELVCR
jgi:hypothetical protein